MELLGVCWIFPVDGNAQMTLATPVSEASEEKPKIPASSGVPPSRELYLDVFRAVACLMVFFYHQAINIRIFGTPIYGCDGVHLFFVLSGYLLGGRYVDSFVSGTSLPPPRSYFIKRFLRIYPAYGICLTCFILLRCVTHAAKPPTFGNCVAHYLLIFNYCDRYDFFSINNVIWSLAIEIQFYFVLPLVAWIVSRLPESGGAKGWIFSLSLVLLGVGSRWFECRFINHYNPDATSLVRFKWATSYLDLFAIGIVVRRIELTELAKSRFKPKACALLIALFLCGFWLCWLEGRWSLTAGRWQTSTNLRFLILGPDLIAAAFAMMVFAAGLTPYRNPPFFGVTALAALGRISYSFYLYHTGVQFCVGRIVPTGSWKLSFAQETWTLALGALPIVLFVAWWSYRLVELPFINLSYRLTSSGRGGSSSRLPTATPA
jgi:peptidoglycan/LPS O-acetylase OafA/YrhL